MVAGACPLIILQKIQLSMLEAFGVGLPYYTCGDVWPRDERYVNDVKVILMGI